MAQLTLLLLVVSFASAAYVEQAISFEHFVLGLACIAYVAMMKLLFDG